MLKSLFIIYLSAGFNSLFLYRRLYRSHTALHGFSFDNVTVERKKDLSIEEFYHQYDGKKPVTNNGSHMINYIFLGPLFSKSSCVLMCTHFSFRFFMASFGAFCSSFLQSIFSDNVTYMGTMIAVISSLTLCISMTVGFIYKFYVAIVMLSPKWTALSPPAPYWPPRKWSLPLEPLPHHYHCWHKQSACFCH